MLSQTSDKQRAISLIAVLALMLLFWTGSRYPALNEKAAMGGDLKLQDPMSFELVMPVVEGDPVWRRTLATSVNWVATNRQGMTFGVLLGAGFLTLIPLFPLRSPGGYFAGSAMGVAIGTPMGVCVNCAAPIATGMHSGGARLETTLATMISSPTLNVVVLTMMFTLLPSHLVLIKIVFTLIFLLLCLPLLTPYLLQLVPSAQLSVESGGDACDIKVPGSHTVHANQGWVGASAWFARSYAGNLWYIVKLTVPLMLLAGFLGALLVSILPWDQLLPSATSLSAGQQALIVTGLALFGLFLPVPIAFDVVVSAALLASGFPASYVMVLLFTLGIFSIYSFSIVGRSISWAVATIVSACLLVLGLGAAATAHKLDQWVEERNTDLFYRTVAEADDAPPVRYNLPAVTAEFIATEPLIFTWLFTDQAAGTAVYRLPHRERPGTPDLTFKSVDARSMGLLYDQPRPAMQQFILPFSEIAGIASGDINGDDWPDLLINANNSLRLFNNMAGAKFSESALGLEAFDDSAIVASALVDLDDDGDLDIFFSAFRRGHFILSNQDGMFPSSGLTKLPADAADVARSVGFGDLDKDGRLEIAVGNYVAFEHAAATDRSTNTLYSFRDGAFAAEKLAGPAGTTLSVLISDINNDNEPDLLLGNDYAVADSILLGDGQGKLRHITMADKFVGFTASNTMSIDSADIDNDGDLELFLVQITGNSSDQRNRLRVKPYQEVCAEMPDARWRQHCGHSARIHVALGGGDPGACLEIDDSLSSLDCVATDLLQRRVKIRRAESRKYCDWFQGRWADLSYLCEQKAMPRKNAGLLESRARGYPQSETGANYLFTPGVEGEYLEQAAVRGLDVTGWSWSARFADLDNDQWQDLFVVNGWSEKREWESNLLLENTGDGNFADITVRSGLENYRTTGAYSYVDLDRDGDLDIVAVPFDGPPNLYLNNSNAGHSIDFELHDELGNRFGVGSRLTIVYGDNAELRQVRELKLSGGYLSFDAPTIHFGLGEYEEIKRVEIRWSTGETTLLDRSLSADAIYRLERNGPGKS